MGNIDSRAKQDDGYIFVDTDKPFYEPGDEVKGTLYLRLEKTFNADDLELEIECKITSKFTDTIHKMEGEGEERKMVEEKVKRKDTQKGFHFKSVISHIGGKLDAGDYGYPFEFKLPKSTPSSFMYKPHNHKQKPLCSVKYGVIGRLEGKGGSKTMKYKNVFIVR